MFCINGVIESPANEQQHCLGVEDMVGEVLLAGFVVKAVVAHSLPVVWERCHANGEQNKQADSQQDPPDDSRPFGGLLGSH